MTDYFMPYVEANKQLAGAAQSIRWLVEELEKSDRANRIQGKVALSMAKESLEEIEEFFGNDRDRSL